MSEGWKLVGPDLFAHYAHDGQLDGLFIAGQINYARLVAIPLRKINQPPQPARSNLGDDP